MNKEKLIEELKPYSKEDLELIVSTQQDLYSTEEMSIIQELIQIKAKKEKEEQEEFIKEHLPKEISCPKCDGINPFENEKCCYCGHSFDKRKYYQIEYYVQNSNDFEIENDEDTESYTFQYIISFLIPIVGYILGAILLSKEDSDEKSVGKSCIVLGIVSTIISVVASMFIFKFW